jgi:hypothetical protein
MHRDLMDAQFDAVGNQVSQGPARFAWDSLGRLVSIKRVSADTAAPVDVAAYRYNLFGQRIAKTLAAKSPLKQTGQTTIHVESSEALTSSILEDDWYTEIMARLAATQSSDTGLRAWSSFMVSCCLTVALGFSTSPVVRAQAQPMTLAQQMQGCPTLPLRVWTPALAACLAGRYEGLTASREPCMLTVRADGSARYQSRGRDIDYSIQPDTPFRFQRQPLSISWGAFMPTGAGFIITSTPTERLQVEAWPVPRTAMGAADSQRCDLRSYTRSSTESAQLADPMPGESTNCPKTRLRGWSADMAACVAGRYTGRRGDQEPCTLDVRADGRVVYQSRNRDVDLEPTNGIPTVWTPDETRWTVGGANIDGPGLNLVRQSNGAWVLNVWTRPRDAMGAVVSDTCFIESYVALTPSSTRPALAPPAIPSVPSALPASAASLAPIALPDNLPSGWVRRVATFAGYPHRAQFEAEFRQCIATAQAVAQGLNQPYAPPAMPLTAAQLASLDQFIEFDAYDSRVHAARYERVGPHTARVDVNERIRGATLVAVPNCANVQYQVAKAATVWSRDGKIYELRYVGDRPPTVSNGRPVGVPRQTAVGAAQAASTAFATAMQRRQVAGQACLEQPPMQFMGVRSTCLWEPFARVKYHNLPIALEASFGLGVINVQSRAEQAALADGPWAAPIGTVAEIDEIPSNATAAPTRARRAATAD